VRVVRSLIERWGARLKLRRLILTKLIRFGGKDEAAAARHRLTGLHLLGAVLADGLPVGDDPEHTPQVKKGAGYVAYTPVAPREVALAVFDAMARLEITIHLASRRVPLMTAGTFLIWQVDKRASAGSKPRAKLWRPAATVLGMLLARLDSISGASHMQLVVEVSKLLGGAAGLLTKLRSDATNESIERLLIMTNAISANFPPILLYEHATLGRYLLSKMTKVYGESRVLPCTFPVPSLYLPCTFPVPSLYLPCTRCTANRASF
jgi:hypothetical protein